MSGISTGAVIVVVLAVVATLLAVWWAAMAHIDRRRDEREQRAMRSYWRGLP